MQEELETTGSEIKEGSEDAASSKVVSSSTFFNFCQRELAPLSPAKSYNSHFGNNISSSGYGFTSHAYNFKEIIDLDAQLPIFPKAFPKNTDLIEALMHDNGELSPSYSKRINGYNQPEFFGNGNGAVPQINPARVGGIINFTESMEEGMNIQNCYNPTNEQDFQTANNNNNMNSNNANNNELANGKKKGPGMKNKSKAGTQELKSSLSLEKTIEKKKKTDGDLELTSKKNRDGRPLKSFYSPQKSPESNLKRKSTAAGTSNSIMESLGGYGDDNNSKSGSDKKSSGMKSAAANPQLYREYYKKHPFSKNGTFGCKCKKTKCLKLYCECFSNKELCKDTCNCQDCSNKFEEDNEDRDQAIHNLLLKNPEAFSSKVLLPNNLAQSAATTAQLPVSGSQPGGSLQSNPTGMISGNQMGSRRSAEHETIGMNNNKGGNFVDENKKDEGDSKHNEEQKSGDIVKIGGDDRKLYLKKGCNCKKSNCKKKYCECFGAGFLCSSEFCKCEDCRNGKDNNNNNGGGRDEGKSEGKETIQRDESSEKIEEGKKKKLKLNNGEESNRPVETLDK